MGVAGRVLERSGEGVGVWGGLGGHGGGGAKEVRASIETLGFYEREREQLAKLLMRDLSCMIPAKKLLEFLKLFVGKCSDKMTLGRKVEAGLADLPNQDEVTLHPNRCTQFDFLFEYREI